MYDLCRNFPSCCISRDLKDWHGYYVRQCRASRPVPEPCMSNVSLLLTWLVTIRKRNYAHVRLGVLPWQGAYRKPGSSYAQPVVRFTMITSDVTGSAQLAIGGACFQA